MNLSFYCLCCNYIFLLSLYGSISAKFTILITLFSFPSFSLALFSAEVIKSISGWTLLLFAVTMVSSPFWTLLLAKLWDFLHCLYLNSCFFSLLETLELLITVLSNCQLHLNYLVTLKHFDLYFENVKSLFCSMFGLAVVYTGLPHFVIFARGLVRGGQKGLKPPFKY